MSPTVRRDDALDLDIVHGSGSSSGTSGRLRAYAIATLAGALGAGITLIARGASFPPAGALLLLLIPLALCMNRFVFFPNEVGVTADAAVIFAAMIGFRAEAVWLGPLLVALAVGPLDVTHWHERAFVRMTYNSGSSALVTLVSVAAFVPLSHAWGSSWPALLGAGAVAAVIYLLTESVFGVVLVALRGEPTRAAIRHQLPVNSVAVPLALYGTIAGLLVSEAGWAPALLMLLPVPLVPELLLVELPRRWRTPQPATLASVTVVVAVLGALALALPIPPLAVVAWLVVIAALVAIESRVSERGPVPALSAVGVVAAVVVVQGGGRFLAAVVAVLGATVAGWALTPRRGPGRAPRFAVVLAMCGALVGAGLYTAVHLSARSPLSVTMAVFAGLASLVVTERRRSTATWCVPVAAAAAALAELWREIGVAGGLLFIGGLLLVLGAAAAWGAAPWRSRVLGPQASPFFERWRRPALVGVAAAAVLAAGVASTVAVAQTRTTWLLVAVVLTEADLAMALMGVRQWRFAPRPRATEAVVLGATAIGVCLGVPSAGWPDWSGPAITAAAVALSLWIAWPLSRRSSFAAAAPRRLDPRSARN